MPVIESFDAIVPYTVFIDPQLGRIGLSEQEAREQQVETEIQSLQADSESVSVAEAQR